MGFFDSLGKILGSAAGAGIEMIEKEQELINDARKLDDETLKRRFKSETNSKKKFAYGSVLKERGYVLTNSKWVWNDIKNRYRQLKLEYF